MSARRMAYLPGLDGLRALAVGAVLLSHSALGWPRGGFLGVEIFFVISGFIITRGLLLEREQQGGLGLRGFWLRRVRRLLPALGVLCLAVLAYALAFAPDRVAELRGDLPAALGFVTNWHMIREAESYFGGFEEPSLVRHLWSLAVEEQYYLIWPLVLLAATQVFRPTAGTDGVARYRGLAVCFALAALAAAVAMAVLHVGGSDPMRLYYGTDTRATGLLLGATLACLWAPGLGTAYSLPTPSPGRRLDLLGAAGGVLLLSLLLFMDDGQALLYRGGFALTGLATLALIVATTREGTHAARLAGGRVPRWIGQRSYGLYLWHWPVMLIVAPSGLAAGAAPLVMLLQVAIVTAAAEASYRWVEMPVRNGILGRWWSESARLLPTTRRERRMALMTTGIAVLLAGAALSWPLLLAQSPEQPGYFDTRSVRIVSTPAPAAQPRESAGTASPASSVPAAQPGAEVPATVSRQPDHALADPGNAAGAVPSIPQVETISSTPSSGSSTSSAAPDAQKQEPPTPEPPTPEPNAIVVPGGVTALGDSVMVGAAHTLVAGIANIEVDAEVGRQTSAIIGALRDRVSAGTLGRVVVLHVGNNGTITEEQFDEIMSIAGSDRRVIFLSITVPRDWAAPNNDVINDGIARHPNAVLADWNAACLANPDALWTDGVHIGATGAALYLDVVVGQLTG